MKLIKAAWVSVILITTLSITSFLSAEGLFGGLFNNQKSNTSFSKMLSHVPDETHYLFANQKPITDDVIQFQLERWKTAIDQLNQSITDKKPSTKKESQSSQFFDALLADLIDKVKHDQLDKTGLSLNKHHVLYSMDLMPVIRMSISNKQAIIDTLKRAEKKSGYPLSLTTCNQLTCFIQSDEDNNTLAIVILDDHIAFSVFKSENKDALLKHLTGKSHPKKAYSPKKWQQFLDDNHYLGFADGFINLQTILASMKPMIVKEEPEVEACLAVLDDHLTHIPNLFFGITALQKKQIHYELLLKSSEGVSTALQTIANKKNITQRIDNTIADIALNINFIQLREALTQYSVFLGQSADKNKCKSINSEGLTKATSGFAVAMNMGLSQLQSIYLSLNDIQLDKHMQPEKIEAYGSIGTQDPVGLVRMLALINPLFATLTIPDNGKTVALPDNIIPSKKSIPLALSRGKEQLNVMLGNNKPKLVSYSEDVPEIMSITINSQRYYKTMIDVMRNASPSLEEEQQKAINIIQSMSHLSGKGLQRIRADKRGLVLDIQVQYD